MTEKSPLVLKNIINYLVWLCTMNTRKAMGNVGPSLGVCCLLHYILIYLYYIEIWIQERPWEKCWPSLGVCCLSHYIVIYLYYIEIWIQERAWEMLGHHLVSVVLHFNLLVLYRNLNTRKGMEMLAITWCPSSVYFESVV
jgi:hypothetical protein